MGEGNRRLQHLGAFHLIDQFGLFQCRCGMGGERLEQMLVKLIELPPRFIQNLKDSDQAGVMLGNERGRQNAFRLKTSFPIK